VAHITRCYVSCNSDFDSVLEITCELVSGLLHPTVNRLLIADRYVALSSNDNTGFRARELKSIHVDAIGCFVKFVIHKNHANKHNAFNQVIWCLLLLYYCTL